MSKYILLVGLLIAVFSIGGCNDSPTTPTDTLTVPTTYDSTGWSTSTTQEYMLRSNTSALLAVLKSVNDSSTLLVPDQLFSIYANLEPYVNPVERDRIRELLNAAIAASGHAYNWTAEPSSAGAGGVYGSRLFDEYGRDLKELTEKGLFIGLFYYQALQTMKGTVTPKSVDQIVALFGANPSFPNGSSSAVAKDAFAAGYAAKRDKNDGNGFYTKFKQAALKAKAASADPLKYAKDLSDALETMRSIWERSLMATSVSYAYETITNLTASNIDDASRAAGMHSYGECSGIVQGMWSVNSSDRTLEPGPLQQMLTQLRIPQSALPACYLFWQQTAANIASIEAFTKNVKTSYGFTDTEMADFKINWVSVQGR